MKITANSEPLSSWYLHPGCQLTCPGQMALTPGFSFAHCATTSGHGVQSYRAVLHSSHGMLSPHRRYCDANGRLFDCSRSCVAGIMLRAWSIRMPPASNPAWL